MKKLIGFFILIICNLIVLAQTSFVKEINRDDFENMTFEVGLDKNIYVLSQPILVTFKLSNRTDVSQAAYSPSFIQESRLKVNFRGQTSVFEHLSSVSGPGIRFPGTIPAGACLTSDEMFSSPLVASFFPEPGNYQIQFELHSPGGDKTIQSNILDVTIVKPTGANKEALDYMKKHHEFFGLSSWTPEGNENQALLETFVNKYGESVYGEIAISNLGAFYLAKGEFDKAKAEFEKISGSQNTVIAKEANDLLADIARKKADLQKMQKPE